MEASGNCFRISPSLTDRIISPLTVKYACTQLSRFNNLSCRNQQNRTVVLYYHPMLMHLNNKHRLAMFSQLVFVMRININRIPPIGPHGISVPVGLISRHLRYHLTHVPLQPNSLLGSSNPYYPALCRQAASHAWRNRLRRIPTTTTTTTATATATATATPTRKLH